MMSVSVVCVLLEQDVCSDPARSRPERDLRQLPPRAANPPHRLRGRSVF